jgi:hypothetical protein
MPCMVLSYYNIVKMFVFFQTTQSDIVFIKFQTFHGAVVRKECFIVHLFGHRYVQPFWTAVVAESTVL